MYWDDSAKKKKIVLRIWDEWKEVQQLIFSPTQGQSEKKEFKNENIAGYNATKITTHPKRKKSK